MWIDESVPRPVPRHRITWSLAAPGLRCGTCNRPVGWKGFRQRDGLLVAFLCHFATPEAARAATSRVASV